jgi:hypothetical protein
MKTQLVLTPQEKNTLLNEHVFYEIIFALGVSVHDAKDYCVWEHLNFSRMGHARALIYFFECPKDPRKFFDDLLSEDFGFPHEKIQLSQSDRDRLNKDLYHLSAIRLRHNPESKPWPDVFLNRVHERCVKFIQFILSPQIDPNIIVLRQKWEWLLQILESGNELCISSSINVNNVFSGFQLSQGRRLNSGLSELTPIFPK